MGDYILRLGPLDASGIPTNDVLAEASVANAAVPDFESIVNFVFVKPATVGAGTEYALILTRPGGDLLAWDGHINDTCAGSAFVSRDQSAPFLAAPPGIDLIFTTFVSS
jgi:hypothetical protein